MTPLSQKIYLKKSLISSKFRINRVEMSILSLIHSIMNPRVILLCISIIFLCNTIGAQESYSNSQIITFVRYYEKEYGKEEVEYYEAEIKELESDTLLKLLKDLSGAISFYSSSAHRTNSLISQVDFDYGALRGLLSYSELVRRNECGKDAYYFSAYLKNALGLYKEAVIDYTHSINSNTKSDIKNSDIYGDRGSAKLELEDFDGAIDDFTYAIDHSINEVISEGGNLNALKNNISLCQNYIEREKAYFMLEEYDEAINDFTSGSRISYECSQCYFLRGLANIQIEMMDLGCKDLKTARDLGYEKANDEILRFCSTK